MFKSKSFKVVIVGASITGLVLANMLEALDIDFVVLEGHKEIAPTIGASIVVQGTLARILDQLGCWEAVMEVWNRPIKVMSMTGPDGTFWSAFRGSMEQIERRHGYPLPVIARKDLLKILYSNLKQKDKVMTEMRVEEVVKADGGVVIKMKGGQTIEGDLLIGADGVHSTVRKEMWRLAKKDNSGAFSDDEPSKVICQRMCMFGITNPRKGETPFMHFGANFNRIYLSALSTDDVVFWFLFDDIKEGCDGNSIPRFTKADERALVDRFGDDNVSPKWTLREIYDDSAVTGATAIVEHIYDRWHYQRILTIGDSAHSQNPLGGFGGASCTESAATFANALKDALDKAASSPSGRLSEEDLDKMLASVRNDRLERLKGRLDEAKTMATTFSLRSLLTLYMVPFMSRVQGQQGQLQKFADNWLGATCLKHLPKPQRRHAIPWNDELPTQPLKNPSGELLAKGLAAGTLVVSFLAANALLRSDLGAPYDSFAGHRPVLDSFTGIKAIDHTLAGLGSLFSYSVVQTGQDAFPKLQLINLLSSLAPIYAIWTVEANRKSNRFSPITLPVIFTVLAQIFSLGKVAHFYYFFSILATPAMNTVVDKQVPVSASRAVLPAICIGYILPTVLMFLPFRNDFVSERFIAFWQASPVLFATLAFLFGAAFKAYDDRRARLQGQLEGKTEHEVKVQKALDTYNNVEVAPLKSTYAFVFFTSALVHVAAVLYAWIDTGKSIAAVLASFVGLESGLPNPFSSASYAPADASLALFKFDMLFTAVPLLVFLFYTVWDIRRRGYITTPTANKAAAAVVAGQVLVGPAATYAGLWYWRESVLANLAHSPCH